MLRNLQRAFHVLGFFLCFFCLLMRHFGGSNAKEVRSCFCAQMRAVPSDVFRKAGTAGSTLSSVYSSSEKMWLFSPLTRLT